jgi:hypothetical protein
MASRLPLFAAALLFAIGIIGLVTTAPGREFGGAFLPLLEPGARAAPAPAIALNPIIPPIRLSATATTSAPPTPAEVVVAVATPAAVPSASPTPSVHVASTGGIAADDSPDAAKPMVAVAVALAADAPPPTREPVRPVMLAADGDGPVATTPSPQADDSSTPTPSETTPTPAPTATPVP